MAATERSTAESFALITIAAGVVLRRGAAFGAVIVVVLVLVVVVVDVLASAPIALTGNADDETPAALRGDTVLARFSRAAVVLVSWRRRGAPAEPERYTTTPLMHAHAITTTTHAPD
jgi:hypothetical protein